MRFHRSEHTFANVLIVLSASLLILEHRHGFVDETQSLFEQLHGVTLGKRGVHHGESRSWKRVRRRSRRRQSQDLIVRKRERHRALRGVKAAAVPSLRRRANPRDVVHLFRFFFVVKVTHRSGGDGKISTHGAPRRRSRRRRLASVLNRIPRRVAVERQRSLRDDRAIPSEHHGPGRERPVVFNHTARWRRVVKELVDVVVDAMLDYAPDRAMEDVTDEEIRARGIVALRDLNARQNGARVDAPSLWNWGRKRWRNLVRQELCRRARRGTRGLSDEEAAAFLAALPAWGEPRRNPPSEAPAPTAQRFRDDKSRDHPGWQLFKGV
ncbi:hypothetical protein BE221DRAFT_50551, partial [Ostreococcus tauri]